MYDFMPILARLKEAKRNVGMTNAALSEASGVSLGTLNKILSGDTSEPKLPALMSIAHALGVSVDYLIYGKSEKPVVSDGFTDDERKLLDLFRLLNPEGREKALDLLDDLVQSGKYVQKSEAAVLVAKEVSQ